MSTKGQHILLSAHVCSHVALFRQPLITELLRRGHRITILAEVDEFIGFIHQYPTVNFIPVKKLNRGSINPLYNLQFTHELYSIYRSVRPDLIIHFTIKPNIFGSIAARALGIKSVAVISGLGTPFAKKGWLKTAVKKLYRFALQFSALIISENREDAEYLKTEGIVPAKKLKSVSGCGVNFNHFKPTNQRKKSNRIVFTFIGRMIYDKGIREFAEASKMLMKENGEVECQMVGQLDPKSTTAVDADELAKWAKAIKYIGFIRDIRTILAGTDCVVLPSYREAISKVVQEAFAMAIPVITTDAPGGRECVTDGENGLLARLGDVEDLYEKMKFFASMSEEDRIAMGERGRSYALKNFDQDKIVGIFIDHLESTLDLKKT